MKKLLLALVLVLAGIPLFAADVLITEVAPVGDLEFSEDWIEIQNLGTSNVILNETYTLELSAGNTVALLSAGETITLAADDTAVIHFTAGINDTQINDNNPGYWDIYMGNDYHLSANYQVISLKEDASAYEDVVYYASSSNSYADALLTQVVPSQWESIDRPVYYYVGNVIKRLDSDDSNNAYDWTTIAMNDATPGREDFVDITTLPVELCQNYPNPFKLNETTFTTIKYYLPETVETLEIKIYTLAGDIIRTLVNNEELLLLVLATPGYHEIGWDGLNDQGKEVQTGNYLIGLNAGGTKKVKKMTFIR